MTQFFTLSTGEIQSYNQNINVSDDNFIYKILFIVLNTNV